MDERHPAAEIELSEDLLFEALTHIYHEQGGKPGTFDRQLFDAVRGSFDRAVTAGIEDYPEVDNSFASVLRHSADVFAAFKVHRAQADMRDLLLDSNGDLKPFEQWANDVLPIASHQFGPWLRTEYDTAVIRANQAAQWQRFEKYKDILPNLKWVPSTSVKPGADHLPFWGTIRSIDDPFWSSHRPGDRWNCKCSLAATDDPTTELPPEAVATDPHNAPQSGLKSNPGKQGKLFDESHPYFPGDCASCPFNTGFKAIISRIFTNRKKDCNSCSKINNIIKKADLSKIIDNREFYNVAKTHPEISHTYYDEESNGVLAIDCKHNIGLPSHSRKYPVTKDWLQSMIDKKVNNYEELVVALKFVALGHRVVLLPEKEKGADGDEMSALDLEVDGVRMDIKTVIGSGKYSNFLEDKNEQLMGYNERKDINESSAKASTLCVYFPKNNYDVSKMRTGINNYKRKTKPEDRHLKHIKIMQGDSDSIIDIDI